MEQLKTKPIGNLLDRIAEMNARYQEDAKHVEKGSHAYAILGELCRREFYTLITEDHPSAMPYEDYMREIGVMVLDIE